MMTQYQLKQRKLRYTTTSFGMALFFMCLLFRFQRQDTFAFSTAFNNQRVQKRILVSPPCFMGRRSFASVIDIMTYQQQQQRYQDDEPVVAVNFDNFWIQTVANFTACSKPSHAQDYTSKGGSLYWKDGTVGVIRYSDHWSGQYKCGKIKDCYWTIDIEQPKPNQCVTGRCNYVDFYKGKKKSMKKRQKWSARKN